MQESIAKALRRGENRRIAVRASGYRDRVVARHAQEGRGPWYRHAVESLRRDPAAVTVWEAESGTGTRRVFQQLAIAQDARRRWSLVFREVDARGKRVGLWKDSNPVPPWEWRGAKRSGNGNAPRG